MIMIFSSTQQAEQFQRDNMALLQDLSNEVERIDLVSYSEVWLNGNGPSFIAGYSSEDEQIVSLPIQ